MLTPVACIVVAPISMTAMAQYASTPPATQGQPAPADITSAYSQNTQAYAHDLQPSTQGLQGWRFEPSISVLETLTNNVNLSPSSTAQGDFVSQITPALSFSERSARTSLQGNVAVAALVYARTGSQNNDLYPSVHMLGSVEGIEKFFYLEGAVDVSQSYFSPFGAQPQDLTNGTQNRYTSATYRLTPYIQGTWPGDIKYELRDDNTLTNLSNTPTQTSNVYYNELKGNLSSPVDPLGWALDYDHTNIDFKDQRSTRTQLWRATLLGQVDPQVRLDIDAGYENNEYPFATYDGTIYGAGIHWNPTPRTKVVANWEHRFFGSSYLFSFDHRTPLSAISVQASRNTSSYPQQFLSLPATGNVPQLLDFLLQSQIPDAQQRLNTVNQILQDRGLPNVLTGPVNLYAQQTYLLESASATYGVLGARNNIFFTGFYLRTEPISGAGSPIPGVFAVNNNTQTGGSITWTHNLTGTMTLNTSYTQTRTVANAPLVGTTNQGYVTVGVIAMLSPNTSVTTGARYQLLHSDVSPEYNETAIFAGLNHRFK